MVVLDGFGRGIFCTKEPSGNHPSVNKPPLGATLEPRLLELLASIASRALPSAVRLLAETTFGGTRFSGDWHGKQHSCSFSIYDTVDLLSLFLSRPPSPPLSLSLALSVRSLDGLTNKVAQRVHSKHFARDLESFAFNQITQVAESQAAKIQSSCPMQHTEHLEASASSSLELLVLQEMKDIVGSLE